MLELTPLVDTSFQTHNYILDQVKTESDFTCDFSTDLQAPISQALPSSLFSMSGKDKKEISSLLNHIIATLEREIISDKINPFELEHDTENLHGEFDKYVAKYNDRPELKNILLRYKEVFGPLHPPGTGCQLDQMHL